jgi:hypothetical protein
VSSSWHNGQREEAEPQTMKYYVAHACTRDGEHEYGEQFTLTAGNEHEAGEAAKKYLVEVHADPDEDSFDAFNQLDLFDRIVEFNWVMEISKEEYAVLRKFL